MGRLTRAWQRLRALYTRDAIEDEIHREVRLHVDLLAEEYERDGMSREEARRAALRRFGNVRSVTERGLDVRGAGVLEQTLMDLKHTVRGLARNRTFAVTVTLTLALAIGAHTAVFAVVHSVLLQWPYPHADRLVSIETMRMLSTGEVPASIPEYADWKSSSHTFETIEAYAVPRGGFFGGPAPSLSTIRVTSGLLDLLGVRPAVGRLLHEDDFRPDAPPVVVLAHQTWVSRFGEDPHVIGRSIDIAGTTPTVVGVTARLRGPLLANIDVSVFVPWLEGPQLRALYPPPLLARLRQGATVTQAQAEVDAIGWPSPPSIALLIDATVSRVRPTLLALLGATGLILLIAVTNVANLFLARSTARSGEMSVRAVLGAGRTRLSRLLFTESLLLALVAGAGGLAIASLAIQLLQSMDPTWVPRRAEIAIDTAVLAAAGVVTASCGLLIGLASTLALRGALAPDRMGARSTSDRRTVWVRSGLVATQLALSVVLLAGSALVIRSYVSLLAVPLGIDYRNVVSFALPGGDGFRVGPADPATAERLQQYRRALEYVRAVPGVLGATLTSQPPLSGSSGATGVEVLTGAREGERLSVGLVGVTEDFFDLFDSRAVSGRLFDATDALRIDSVVVVDANVARLLWPGESAVGQRIRMYDVESEVIGVSEPVRYGNLTGEMHPKLYHLLGRSGGGISGGTFLVRHDGSSGRILAAIEARMKEADATLELASARPLAEIYDGYLREPRFYLILLGTLGVLALVVATIGVYGVVAYAVTRRTGEIGIRMVLGARWLQIVGLFCRQTLLVAALGIGVGLAGAASLTRYIENLLFGIEPTDLVAFVSVAALLSGAAVVATLVPMRRALRVDPATTLRSE